MSASTNYPTIRPSLLLDFANTEQLDPRITFARSTTATYYDDNTVAKAEENLVLYSQQFDNAYWNKTSTTVTADTIAAPDGTTTADSLIEAAATTDHQISEAGGGVYMNTVTTPFTFSVYVKANTRSFVYLFNNTSNQSKVWFNLSTGAIGTASIEASAISNANIVSVGGGWYRVSAVFNNILGAGRQFGLGLASADGVASYLGDGTSGVYIWGAQREARTFITAYTPTTTAPITNYIPVLMTAAINEARLDHNPTTRESLGLLIEEQRTNLLTYSEQFDNGSVWGKTGSTVSQNVMISPEGTLSADCLVESTATSTHRVLQSVSGVSVPVTQSVYVKYAGRRYFQIYTADNTTNYVTFDVQYGAITRVGSSIVSSSIQSCGNGWYRCTATYSSASGAFYYGLADVGTAAYTPSYTGDGYSGVYIWGAQLEAGSFPTSYIPTVASQVTRSADSASMTGSNFSSWYRADEGTLYADCKSSAISYIGVLGGSGNNEFIGMWNNQAVVSTYNGTSLLNGANNGQSGKLAMAYSSSGRSIVGNAGSVATDSNLIGTNTQILIGTASGVYGSINGTIKRIAYYPARLTNAQLQAITS